MMNNSWEYFCWLRAMGLQETAAIIWSQHRSDEI